MIELLLFVYLSTVSVVWVVCMVALAVALAKALMDGDF